MKIMDNKYQITKLSSIDIMLSKELCRLWKASVSASHHFLSSYDIDNLEPEVALALSTIPNIYILKSDGLIKGFMGVDEQKVEMLFVLPECRGQGIGKTLMQFAIRNLNVNLVDVNEQNPDALQFYCKQGFALELRSPFDSQGRPFPILHLRLKN